MIKVTGFNNFCRVFKVPQIFPKDYCFGGGIPVNFQMVDWFNPVSSLPRWAISEQQYNDLVSQGQIQNTENHTKMVDPEEMKALLIPFLSEKTYAVDGIRYLVICDFGYVFMFTCEKRKRDDNNQSPTA